MKTILILYLFVCTIMLIVILVSDFEPSNGSIFGAVVLWGIFNYHKDHDRWKP